MTNSRYSINDLMVQDSASDPIRSHYIRELLDYSSSEFQHSGLSRQEKLDIINSLGLEILTEVLAECFRLTGTTSGAEQEALFAWQMLNEEQKTKNPKKLG
jgi:hypothetical protein